MVPTAASVIPALHLGLHRVAGRSRNMSEVMDFS